jgi:hypothetical protein
MQIVQFCVLSITNLALYSCTCRWHPGPRYADAGSVAVILTHAWLVDFAGRAACNDAVADDERDAASDVIAAGREPPLRPQRGRLIRLLVIVLTVALAGAVAVALHYRAQASRLHPGRPSATGPPLSSLPQMTGVALRLPADGTITGTVLVTTAAQLGADRAQFAMSAVITGAQPDTVYALTGNDCSAAAPLPDHVWATGVTDRAGAATLTGHAWTGAKADEYWLALDPSPVNSPSGLRGTFAQGRAAPFPAGQAPCAPSP